MITAPKLLVKKNSFLVFGTSLLALLFLVQHSDAALLNKYRILIGANTHLLPIDSTPPIKKKEAITLSTKAARKMMRSVKRDKAYLVDVRTPEEFKAKHLQYAQNINYKSSDFIEKMAVLNKSKPIYLYCRSGFRSGKAADTLQVLGYKQVLSIGALDSLTKAGLPIENQ